MTSVLSMESQHVSSSDRGRNLDACNSSRDRSLSASTAANSEVDFPFDAAWGSDAEDSEDDTNAAIQEAIYEAKSPRRSLAARKPRWADLEDSEDSSPETTSEEFQTTIRASLAADTISSSGSSSSSGHGQQQQQSLQVATSNVASPESTLDQAQADDAAVKPQRRQRGKRGGARHREKDAKHGDPNCETQAAQAWNKQWQADKPTSGRSSSWQNHGGDDGEKQSWKKNSPADHAGRNSAPKDHKYWRQQQAQQEPQKQQCQFNVGIDEDKKFGVVRRLIGSHGVHVKRIAEESGVKLRLRGRGSKFLEGPEQQESPDPLMLCISAPDQWSYAKAVRLVSDHLEKIYADHRAHCEKKNLTVKDLCIDMHEGRREGNYY